MPEEKWDKWLNMAGGMMRGLVAQAAPGIFKGYLNELLSQVSLKEITIWVQEDRSLWNNLDRRYQERIKSLRLDVKWLTADWAIKAVQDKRPDLASLFTNWQAGYDWLDKQAKIISNELTVKRFVRSR